MLLAGRAEAGGMLGGFCTRGMETDGGFTRGLGSGLGIEARDGGGSGSSPSNSPNAESAGSRGAPAAPVS